jgi:hypothetical protein
MRVSRREKLEKNQADEPREQHSPPARQARSCVQRKQLQPHVWFWGDCP